MTIEVPRVYQIFVNARAILWKDGDSGIEYVVQERNRPGQRRCLEFPGGTVEANEPLLTALRREVHEETGLEITEIEGHSVEHSGMGSTVECIEPFAVYQTTKGFNGMGIYFRCRAKGILLSEGDGTRAIRWMPATELASRIADNLDQFNAITAAVLRLMRQKGML